MATSESEGKAVRDPAQPADVAPGELATPSDGRATDTPEPRAAPPRGGGHPRKAPAITFLVSQSSRLRMTRKTPGAGAPAPRAPEPAPEPAPGPADGAPQHLVPALARRRQSGPPPPKAAADDAFVFLTVATHRLHACRLRRRKPYPETAIESFAAALEIKGWHQPILVRPHPAMSGHYEVVVGDLPFQAARRAGLPRLPVALCDLSDLRALECALLEDLRRPDLTELEAAASLRQLIDTCDHSLATLARLLGRSEPQVAGLLRLLEGPGASQDAPAGEPPAPAPTSLGAAMAALERRLADRLGLPIVIASHGQRGGVTITFETIAQLERVVRRLLAAGAPSDSQSGAPAGATPPSAGLAA